MPTSSSASGSSQSSITLSSASSMSDGPCGGPCLWQWSAGAWRLVPSLVRYCDSACSCPAPSQPGTFEWEIQTTACEGQSTSSGSGASSGSGTSSSSCSSSSDSSSSSSSSSNACSTCEIKRIAPAGEGLIVIGQKVTLRIECPQATVSNITWDMDLSETFKNYEADDSAGTLTFLDNADLAAPEISFYVRKPWDLEVTVTFTRSSGGVDTACKKKILLEMIAPNMRIVAPTGIGFATAATNAPVVKLLHSPNFEPVGIAWGVAVTDPPGFSGGTWQFAQLWACERFRKDATTGDCEVFSCTTGVALDNSFPYPSPQGEPPQPHDANGQQFVATDSPTQGTNTANYSQIVIDDIFYMYIMYKPPGADSKWVALRAMTWTWTCCCTRVAGANLWNVINKSQAISGWGLYPTNPIWTQRLIADGAWSPCDPIEQCVAPPPPPE